jgi:hypothetical protein
MPFLKIVPMPHECDLPDVSKYNYGTVWECYDPECKNVFILVDGFDLFCPDNQHSKMWCLEHKLPKELRENYGR